MPSNKSPGPNKGSMHFIKDCLPVIIGPLTDIINCSFTTSTFLNSWKVSEVIPLLKYGDHEEPSNNCPLSMLAVAWKIGAKVARQQFRNIIYNMKATLVNIKVVMGNIILQTLGVMISDFLLDAMDNKRLSALILLAIPYYYRSWALSLPRPQNGLRVTCLTELNWSVLAHLPHLHPLLSQYCHHFCFVFTSMILYWLHKYAMSSPT